MRPDGWLLLALFWSTIIAVVAYCFYRVFTKENDQ